MPDAQVLQMVMFHAFKARDTVVEAQIAMAAHSIRVHYPAAMIVLLTNALGAEAEIPPWVEVQAAEIDLSRVMRERVRIYSEHVQATTPGVKIVFLDTDMLVVRRFDEILAPAADLALTVRKKPSAPINGGLIIVDTTRHEQVASFFERFLACCSSLPAEEQRWEGDQTALRMLLDPPVRRMGGIEEVSRGELRVRFAPTQLFNYTPNRFLLSLGIFLPGARVLHFKGGRKKQMSRYFLRFLSPRFVRIANLLDRRSRSGDRFAAKS